jgi:hypothetical protein
LNAKRSAAESTLTNVEKGLQTFQVTTWKYPIPDNPVNITNSWIIIWQQWIVWPTIRSVVWLSDVKENIVYSRNNFWNKYQLFTQVPSNNTPLKTEAFVKWDSLGIFTDSSGNFISNSIDVRLHSWSLVNAVLSNNKTISWTWEVIKTLVSNFMWSKTWKEFDPNCTIDDIVIWNQVWAGCNSTLWNWLEWGQRDSDIGTLNYNGVISNCYQNHFWTISTWACLPSDGAMLSSSNPKIWFSWVNWYWDGTYNTVWWKFYSSANFASACPAWWRVPSHTDFKELELFFWCNSSELETQDSFSRCVWLWWRNNWANTRKIADALYIPLSWWRTNDGFSYNTRWAYWYLGHTFNSPTEFFSRHFHRNQTWIYLQKLTSSQNAVSIRCIKAY